MSDAERRWPYTRDYEEDDGVEPYDETEDVRPRRDEWYEW